MGVNGDVKKRKQQRLATREVELGGSTDFLYARNLSYNDKGRWSGMFLICYNPHVYSRSGPSATAFWLCVTMLTVIISAITAVPQSHLSKSNIRILELVKAIPIAPPNILKKRSLYQPTELSKSQTDLIPDYGEIEYPRRRKEERGVEIAMDEAEQYEEYRWELLESIDNRGIPHNYEYDEDLEDEKLECRRVSWNKLMFPNCNAFQELSMERSFNLQMDQEYDITFVR